jgi:hypothetical protein
MFISWNDRNMDDLAQVCSLAMQAHRRAIKAHGWFSPEEEFANAEWQRYSTWLLAYCKMVIEQ